MAKGYYPNMQFQLPFLAVFFGAIYLLIKALWYILVYVVPGIIIIALIWWLIRIMIRRGKQQ